MIWLQATQKLAERASEIKSLQQQVEDFKAALSDAQSCIVRTDAERFTELANERERGREDALIAVQSCRPSDHSQNLQLSEDCDERWHLEREFSRAIDAAEKAITALDSPAEPAPVQEPELSGVPEPRALIGDMVGMFEVYPSWLNRDALRWKAKAEMFLSLNQTTKETP